MTIKSKNPNSIFVLASLGVYFGLVLAGSAPRVAAQEAATRHLDIKGETQQMNALDKNPDAEKALERFAATLEDLYRIASEISDGDQIGTSNGQFSLNYFINVSPNGAARYYSRPPFGEKGTAWSRRYIEPLQLLYDAFLPRSDEWNDDFFVQFKVGPTEVSLRATIVTDSLPEASLAYEKALSRRRSTEANFVRTRIYEASTITVEKNKIIVVANLPRAGLDSLLTKNGH